jgi:hypothetical protein
MTLQGECSALKRLYLPSHEKVRSTNHLRDNTEKPLVSLLRSTISTISNTQ